jgi:hypothetical protein
MKFKLKRYIFPYLFQIIKFFIKKNNFIFIQDQATNKRTCSIQIKKNCMNTKRIIYLAKHICLTASSWYLTTLLLDWLPLCASMIAYLHFYFFPNKFFSPLACLHELPKITCHAVLIQQ